MTSNNTPPCELCSRQLPLTFHHLIPRTCHRNKWFRKNFTRDDMRTRGLLLCRDCHKFIHQLFTEKELGRHYNTRTALLAVPKIKRWVDWAQNHQ
ncbi:MAG TPA: hypothetical protein VLL52_25530 [Anaerolineae bacterium]|nr:hypothetical protein [Anaerolineae bacterium]